MTGRLGSTARSVFWLLCLLLVVAEVTGGKKRKGREDGRFDTTDFLNEDTWVSDLAFIQFFIDFVNFKIPFAVDIVLLGYTLSGNAKCRIAWTAQGKKPYWAESLVETFLTIFGGGMIAPVMVGNLPNFCAIDSMIGIFMVSWWLINCAPGDVVFRSFKYWKIPAGCLAEMFRCHTLFVATVGAGSQLEVKPVVRHTSFSIFAPIALGTLGGCGGAFFPLDKGLAPLRKEVNYIVESAMYGAMWVHLAHTWPMMNEFLKTISPKLGELSGIRAALVILWVVTFIVQTIRAPNFNPFTPVHKALHATTRVSQKVESRYEPQAEKQKAA